MIRPFLRSLKLLRSRQKTIFVLLTAMRVVTNLFDVLGLMAIGLLGALLASGLNQRDEASFLGFTVSIESSTTYFWLVVVIAGFFLSKSLLATILLRLSSVFLARAEGKIAVEIAQYIYSGDLSRVKRFSRGELQFVMTTSSQMAVTSLLMSGAAIVTEGALFLFVVVVFILVDPLTASLVSLYFLVLILGFQLLINSRLKRIGQRLVTSSVGVTNIIQDLTNAFREVMVAAKQDVFLSRLGGFRKRYANDMALQAFLMGLPRFFVETGLMIGVLAIIGFQFLRGDLSDGLVTTAVFLAGGVRMMAALLPLQNAVANIKTMGPQALIAQELIEETRKENLTVSDQLVSVENSFSAGDIRVDLQVPSVELDRVTYTHPGSNAPALIDVTLAIPEGTFAAFVGPSGAGKTTLVDVILGVNNPDSGSVLVGGYSPRHVRDLYPGAIGYVPQTPGMVSGSIAENVALGVAPELIDDNQVWDALEKCQLADFIRELPEGIHSDLGKQSESLSGGQRQRIGLARALYHRPKLLVLDEATSNLDPQTEASISAVIEKLAGSATVIVIAHRLSTIRNADVVFVVDGGQMVSEGTFDEVRKAVPMVEDYVRLATFE